MGNIGSERQSEILLQAIFMKGMISEEPHVRILISLLKQHGVRWVVASPGTTNSAFVNSIHAEGSFRVFSSVDERSAAYLACGLAEESNEPVVITCTGATASRNYLPGLTEAYYRKLPILAVTGTQPYGKIGHHVAQIIDRSVLPNDVAKLSVSLPIVKDESDKWDCEIKTNKAILELSRNGGGPVHINLPTTYTNKYSAKPLESYRCIRRFTLGDELPDLSGKNRIGIFIGSHKKWSGEEIMAIEHFCESHNAVVFCDHTSGYRGKYKVHFALVAGQTYFPRDLFVPDLLIHIGEISGDYASLKIGGKEVWRVNEDGELRDTFGNLANVFQMTVQSFFSHYAGHLKENLEYYHACIQKRKELAAKIPENIPFSNIWVARKLHPFIPKGSTIHFGILNSLRSWNFFELDETVTTASNVGGFGIDGGVSSLFGASLYEKDKLYFCVIGDLAFFYDINVLGNRHLGKNLRILLINNGKGVEFRQYNHYALQFGSDADEFIAAAGHFGNKSPDLVKDFAKNLGFKYLSASTKEEFMSVHEEFVDPRIGDKSVIFEVFTDGEQESKALEMISTLIEKPTELSLKETAKTILGSDTLRYLKKTISRK